MKLDDETMADLQGFTSLMHERGFSVIGGIFRTVNGKMMMSTFSTAPEGGDDLAHVRSLVSILYHTVMGKQPEDSHAFPLKLN